MVHSNSLHYDSSIGMGFPDGLVVKNPPPKAEGPGSIPGSGRFLGGGQGNPLQYSCLENAMDSRSMAGDSSWDCKELNMTEST